MRTIIRNNYDPQMGDYHEKILIDEERHKKWIFDCDGVFSDFTNPLVVSERGESQDFAASQEWVTREVETLESGKQDKLTAGDNITIEDNVISAIAATYVAGDNIQINGNVISATDTIYDDTEVKSDITNLQNEVQSIEEKIPSAASSANQLADKNFVNSSIATNTANFIGTFNSVAELEAYSGPLTNNDYAFVVVTDAVGNTAYDRYKYNGNTSEWLFEYELNNSSFTADQWAAINSGITSGDVTKLGNLADIQTIGANLTLTNGELSATDTTYTAGTNVQISNQNVISATDTTYTAGTGLDLNGTEFSVDTTVIAEKTDIPTVNNATLTITQNGTSAGTFTANSATDATIALTDTTYSNYTGATSLADGTAGLVPAPLAGDETKFLSGNGQWTTVSQYSLPIASANDLGGIKVGNNLTINSTTGVLDATDTTYSNFTGTDGQTAGTAGLVPAPATTDAGKFLKANGTWDTTDGVKVLTSADYNYPTTGTKTAVALWLLDSGIYQRENSSVNVRINASTTAQGEQNAYIVVKDTEYDDSIFVTSRQNVYLYRVNPTTGAGTTGYPKLFLTDKNVKDELTSTLTNVPLSANQGRVLKDLIDSLVIKAAGAPTTSTVGTVGMLYEDTTNGDLYICTDITGGVYTWEEVGGGPTVVQTTGQSTTDVMSQNATTSMVYADPSTKQKVQIGSGANAGSGSNQYNGVAIGYGAEAASSDQESFGPIAIGRSAVAGPSGIAIGNQAYGPAMNSGRKGTIALGHYSGDGITASGMMDIGTRSTTYGYSNSNYRLLTGLYDPQSAHDAANKEYVDGKILTNAGAPTTSTAGTVGQLLQDSTNGKLYICTDATNPYVWEEVGGASIATINSGDWSALWQ